MYRGEGIRVSKKKSEETNDFFHGSNFPAMMPPSNVKRPRNDLYLVEREKWGFLSPMRKRIITVCGVYRGRQWYW